MGMNNYMRAEYDKEEAFEKELQKIGGRCISRGFNAFGHGIEAIGENCEFNQIQNLYEIDLSPLRFYNYGRLDVYTGDVQGELDWELYKAKTEEEKARVKAAFKIKLEEAKQKDEEEYQNKWLETKIIKSTILSLIEKIKANPALLDKITYSLFFDKEVFNMQPKNINAEYYIKEDLDHMLRFIDLIERKGIFRMAFYHM